jgi:hypothetical protein
VASTKIRRPASMALDSRMVPSMLGASLGRDAPDGMPHPATSAAVSRIHILFISPSPIANQCTMPKNVHVPTVATTAWTLDRPHA